MELAVSVRMCIYSVLISLLDKAILSVLDFMELSYKVEK